jgi:hypothetical protein
MNRLPLIGGVAFAVLSLAALLLVPLPPGVDQPGSALIDHFSAHSGLIRLQALLTALSLLALVVVLGFARDRLHGPAGYIFTIGAAVLLVEISIEVWFTAGMALHAGELEPATARTLMDIAAMWGPLLTVADIMLAGPVVWAARSSRFPRWLALIAAVFATEQFVELVTIIGPSGTFVAPGGAMNMFLGGALFLVFFVALGIAVSLPPGAEGSSPAASSRSTN